jgi:hypothetical protein
MAVHVDESEQLEVLEKPTGDDDPRVVPEPGSGVVLPIVHTSIDAALLTEHGGHRILITVDRTQLETPPIEHLAFYAGLGALVGVGLVELPIAVALGVGHVLIDLTRRPGLQALGEALNEA